MRTVSEIRRARLLQLIEQAGSIQAVADKIGRSHAQVSQWKNMNTRSSGRPSVIGAESARLIEEAFNKPRGWMDADPVHDAAAPGAQVVFMAMEPAPAYGGGILEDLEDLLPEDADRFRAELEKQAAEAERLRAEIRSRAEQMRRHRDYLLTKAGAKRIAPAERVAHIPPAPKPSRSPSHRAEEDERGERARPIPEPSPPRRS
jgi:transcriptional regulator with XRE-family HTH domain